MKITTIRMPEGLAEDLEEEAEQEDLSFSEYARRILRNRDRIRREKTDEYDNRLRDLEQRVDELENNIEPSRDRDDQEVPDVVEWLRKNQPASKAEIVEHCYPEDSPAKPGNWWERHGREDLKTAGAQFTRNVGWELVRD